ncbi:MAG: bifunctional adenosylcobinamide kinase/adenosylcobinamide-phosphate guanylyltransferase [Acidimicrobiales bacterium]
MLSVLLGGARSGKSSLAVAMAGRSGLAVTFIATAEGRDAEMACRIEAHRAERPGPWSTIEEPVELETALSQVPETEAVIVDCLTLWVANLFGRHFDDADIFERAGRVAALSAGRTGPVIVVSNEVGSGIVPADALSRRYRDSLGRVNTAFVARADQAFLVVAGRALALSAIGAPGVGQGCAIR